MEEVFFRRTVAPDRVMLPYSVIPGWTEGPDPESQEENNWIPGSRFQRAPE
jgi:hypothetical protein